MPTLRLELNRDAIAVPAEQAAMISMDVIAAALSAFAEGRLTKPKMPDQFVQLLVNGPEMTSGERRAIYENWLLLRGFQELLRGVRGSLEEAALYLKLIANPPRRVPSASAINEILDPIRKRIGRSNFPDLLAEVNSGLTVRLGFEREFLSMQKVRNCLEHRHGAVQSDDVEGNNSALTLSFPRMKFFYFRGAEEIELVRGERVDDGSGGPDVQILGRIETRIKTFQLGERVTFTPSEFSEIAFACGRFGRQVAEKLPLVP
jgi:hypothetical protein